LVGSYLEQAALVIAARQSAKINRKCLEPMVVILGATGAMQVDGVVLVMEKVPN